MVYIVSVMKKLYIKKQQPCIGRHVVNNLREFEIFRSGSSGGAKKVERSYTTWQDTGLEVLMYNRNSIN